MALYRFILYEYKYLLLVNHSAPEPMIKCTHTAVTFAIINMSTSAATNHVTELLYLLWIH